MEMAAGGSNNEQGKVGTRMYQNYFYRNAYITLTALRNELDFARGTIHIKLGQF
jgi:hypothetical protein